MIKKHVTVFRVLLATIIFGTLLSCSKDDSLDGGTNGESISESALPEASRTTLNTYFADATVTSASMASSANIYNSIYKVLLSNKFEVDFDKDGLWTEIESEGDIAIPTTFLEGELSEIYVYLNANYESNYVVEIERESNGFTLELNNGIDLVFDKEQHFIGVDLDDTEDDERIALTDLPEQAQDFLTTSFENISVVTVKKETDDGVVSYEVYLVNGIKIEFDAQGVWKEIESKGQEAISSALLPLKIAEYILANYNGYIVTEIELEGDGSYAIEITNTLTFKDIELEFDAAGNFLREED
ncbi:PepSY-like domain-containing protein [Sphingobacterium sp. LRF_L2]|uniref:PepSY-like domain-containing protein n=1 Tax=Sphingobacterium sp. LRF_L2 TaxID=3369421 RepID=UPI003F61F22A